MKSLSQAEYGEIRDLYQSIYAPKQVDEEIEVSDEELIEIIEETVIELLEEGYTAEEIEESFDDEFVDEILIEAKVTYGSDTESPEERRARAKAKVGEKRSAARKAAIKSAPGKALRAAARGTERAEKAAKGAAAEAGRRAGNVAVRAKAGATRAAMAATGVKATDVPTKSGKARKNASTFVAGRKSDRDSAKKVMGDKIKSKLGSLGSKVRGAVKSVQMKSDPEKSIKSRIGKARSGLKGMIGKAARKVADKAGKAASRLGEEVETYDVVVEFLCDQGIAENLQEAQWMMVNEIDSEDIATILEAYGLDEIYKGKHGQTEKQYQDSRSDAGKMVSGDSKMSGAAYSSRMMRGTGPNPAGGSKKPEGQGRMTSGARTDLQFRKAALKKG